VWLLAQPLAGVLAEGQTAGGGVYPLTPVQPGQLVVRGPPRRMRRPGRRFGPPITRGSTLSEKKATWTRSDLARQVERLDRRQPALGPRELQDRVDRLVDLALRPGGAAVPLIAPAVAATPPELRRASDGRNEHERHTAVRYASIDALRAEGRLVHAARTGGARVVPAHVVDEHIRRGGLGLDQAAAARHVLASGRRLDVVVGPAGTGKTHTTSAIAEAWKAEHGGAVLGLALSQNAAQVLADASGNRAENIAKWLFENGREPRVGRSRPASW